jgi:hypothetical protein
LLTLALALSLGLAPRRIVQDFLRVFAVPLIPGLDAFLREDSNAGQDDRDESNKGSFNM